MESTQNQASQTEIQAVVHRGLEEFWATHGTLTVIKTDGSITHECIGMDHLPKLQAAVGGTICLVPNFTKFRGLRCDAYVHDEGIFEFPPNPAATRLWQDNTDRMEQGAMLHGSIAIVTGSDQFMDAQL